MRASVAAVVQRQVLRVAAEGAASAASVGGSGRAIYRLDDTDSAKDVARRIPHRVVCRRAIVLLQVHVIDCTHYYTTPAGSNVCMHVIDYTPCGA